MGVKLQVKDLSFSYGSVPVLEQVRVDIEEGEIVSIVGPNGSGKSTLLRHMARVLRPRQGLVLIQGQDVKAIKPKELAKILGYVPQETISPLPITVFEAVLLGRKPYLTWGVAAEDIEAVNKALVQVGLETKAHCSLNELSGGEKQRVSIARAIAQEPEILLFDEPTNNLDIKHQLQVLEKFRELAKKEGCTVIMVLHDLNHAARYSDKMLLLHRGRVFAAGTAKEVLTSHNIASVYGVEVTLWEDGGSRFVMPVRSLL